MVGILLSITLSLVCFITERSCTTRSERVVRVRGRREDSICGTRLLQHTSRSTSTQKVGKCYNWTLLISRVTTYGTIKRSKRANLSCYHVLPKWDALHNGMSHRTVLPKGAQKIKISLIIFYKIDSCHQ